MWHIVTIAVFAITGIAISVLVKDSIVRGFLNALCLCLIIAITWGYSASYGQFGDPIALTRYSAHPPYKVFSATPVDGGSTVLILRGQDGKIAPILFHSLVMTDTNGLYTVVNTGINSYDLESIH